MALPHFTNAKASKHMVDPIYSILFEISSNVFPPELSENIVSYEVDTDMKELEIEFNVNEDTLHLFKDDNIDTNRIDIVMHNKRGEVLRKMFFYDLSICNFIFGGSYELDDLVKITCRWKYEGMKTKDLSDLK